MGRPGGRSTVSEGRTSVAAPRNPRIPAKAGLRELTADETSRITNLIAHAVAPATRTAYLSDWQRWERWCAGRCQALPADPHYLVLYIEHHATAITSSGEHAYAPASITRWVSSINQAHKAAGQFPPGEHPLVAAALTAVRRTRGSKQRRRDPLLLHDIRLIVGAITATASTWQQRVAARRDIAALLTGFTGGCRPGELTDLAVSDVTWRRDDGLHVLIRRSKTDQEGVGEVKALPFGENLDSCPVCAMLAWQQVVNAWDSGGRPAVIRLLRGEPALRQHICRTAPERVLSGAPLFRSVHRTGSLGGPFSVHAINDMIKRRALEAGFDQETVSRLGGHSLRVGFVTQGLRSGASAEQIARQTGHKSLAVLRSYQREKAPLVGNAVTALGL